MIGLDSYSRQVFIYLDPVLIYISLWIDCLFEIRKIAVFPLAFIAGWLQGHWWGFISRNYVVWPTFLLMNVFIALKGSHFWFLFFLPMFRNRVTLQWSLILWTLRHVKNGQCNNYLSFPHIIGIRKLIFLIKNQFIKHGFISLRPDYGCQTRTLSYNVLPPNKPPWCS